MNDLYGLKSKESAHKNKTYLFLKQVGFVSKYDVRRTKKVSENL